MARASILLRVEFDGPAVWEGLDDAQAARVLASHCVTLLQDFDGVDEAEVRTVRILAALDEQGEAA